MPWCDAFSPQLLTLLVTIYLKLDRYTGCVWQIIIFLLTQRKRWSLLKKWYNLTDARGAAEQFPEVENYKVVRGQFKTCFERSRQTSDFLQTDSRVCLSIEALARTTVSHPSFDSNQIHCESKI